MQDIGGAIMALSFLEVVNRPQKVPQKPSQKSHIHGDDIIKMNREIKR